MVKPDKALVLYFLKAIGLYLLWYIIYDLWLKPEGSVDQWLTEITAYSAYRIVNWMGYDTCIEGTQVCVNVVSTVTVGNGCNGLEVFAIFAGFIILFPGKLINKIIYIVGGILFIFLSNLMRVSMLAIDHYKNLDLFSFNHKYTYVFVVYTLVLGLWIIWIKKFSHKSILNVS